MAILLSSFAWSAVNGCSSGCFEGEGEGDCARSGDPRAVGNDVG